MMRCPPRRIVRRIARVAALRDLRRCCAGDAGPPAVRQRVGTHRRRGSPAGRIFAGEMLLYRHAWWQAAPPFIFFVVVMILRDGSGGSGSGLGALVMLPILWVAMYGTRVQMMLAVAATVGVFLLPVLLIGPPDYPASDWRRALVWALVAGTVGPAVQSLVRRLHEREQRQAELAGSLQQALSTVTQTSQRWRALLDHLPDTSVFSIDRDLRHTDAFGAGLDEVGMSRADREDALRDLVAGEHRQARAGLPRRAGRRRGVGRVHRQQRRPDDRADRGAAAPGRRSRRGADRGARRHRGAAARAAAGGGQGATVEPVRGGAVRRHRVQRSTGRSPTSTRQRAT